MIDKILFDNIGLEFEFPHLTESTLSALTRTSPLFSNWRPEHDGSTQREVTTFLVSGGIRLPFNYIGDFSRYKMDDFSGSELVSPILNTENNDWIEVIKRILDVFGNQTLGYPDPMCSFHVHVNMTGAPLYVLKNIIHIWVGIESLMFRLSVAELGYHRGLKRRNFLYCRPISSPQVILDQDYLLRPSYSYLSLLEAKNLREFFLASNNTTITREPSKYNPVRYNALNFFNFVKYGTVEFRTFNISYDWRYIVAWVNLCKNICRSAFGKEYEYEPMLLGTNPNNFDMEVLRVMLGLDDWTMMVLYELYFMNNWVSFDNPSWQFTHLMDNKKTNWSSIRKALQPPIIEGQKIKYYPNKHTDEFAYVKNGTSIINADYKLIDGDDENV